MEWASESAGIIVLPIRVESLVETKPDETVTFETRFRAEAVVVVFTPVTKSTIIMDVKKFITIDVFGLYRFTIRTEEFALFQLLRNEILPWRSTVVLLRLHFFFFFFTTFCMKVVIFFCSTIYYFSIRSIIQYYFTR